VPRTRRVENLRHGARTTTAGTREGSTITVTASPHRGAFFDKFGTDSCNVNCISEDDSLSILDANRKLGAQEAQELSPPLLASRAHSIGFR
jgi:hypothetical protein